MNSINDTPIQSSKSQRLSVGIFFSFWLIIAAFTIQVFFLIQDKSPVTDAVAFHLPNGYAYIKTHDFRMSPATPPLVREWMVLPWLCRDLLLDLSHHSWDEAESVPFGLKFFYEDNRALANTLLRDSRFMVYVLALGVMISVFFWTRKLYGEKAAIFPLWLLSFSPTFVGYSSVANIEIGISLFYLLTMYCLFVFWEENDGKGFPWAVALSLGCALASKYTGVLLLPVVGFICIMRRRFVYGLGKFIQMIFGALIVVWTTYFFEFKPLIGGAVPRKEEKIGYITQISDALFGANEAVREQLVNWALHLSIPLPTWILGFAGIARSHRADYHHFFMGEWTTDGVWYHYLVSFGIKTTIVLLTLILLRFLMLLFIKDDVQIRITSLYLGFPVVILFAATLMDSTGVGMRYLIPTLPFFAIWVTAIYIYANKRIWTKVVIYFLLILHATLALKAFPNYIAYFNQIIGGPENAHQYVRANDLVWGQENANLGRYLNSIGVKEVRGRLFGSYDFTYYGFKLIPMHEDELQYPKNEVYAMSIFKYEDIPWMAQYEPIKKIGHTIWVYDFRQQKE